MEATKAMCVALRKSSSLQNYRIDSGRSESEILSNMLEYV